MGTLRVVGAQKIPHDQHNSANNLLKSERRYKRTIPILRPSGHKESLLSLSARQEKPAIIVITVVILCAFQDGSSCTFVLTTLAMPANMFKQYLLGT